MKIEESEAMKALPEGVKESILDLYPLLEEEPEEGWEERDDEEEGDHED